MASCGGRGARSWIRGNLIGAGTFGTVNLAVNREDGEVFAVKSVRVEQGRMDGAAQPSLEALENEIEILQSLESKYVVRCLGSDWTEEGGKVMRNAYLEYMPEGCLTDFLKQFAGAEAPLDEHLIRTYTRSIVQGIDYLHRQGIVHCDIKGKNILVGNGNVKLTDFGSAKRVGVGGEGKVDGGESSAFAKVNGTPLWMAPEVVRQDEQGLASDIWSLGCTVVEMATGKAPWSDLPNPYVALFQIGCTEGIPAVPASLSAEAHDFLGHCFQRDPRMRWTSSQLLEHPFLTTRHVPRAMVVKEEEEGVVRAESPGSVLENNGRSASSGFSSVFRRSVPILTMPSFLKRGLVREAKEEETGGSRGCSGFSSSQFEMPMEGEWIVVRSPLASPRSADPTHHDCAVLPITAAVEEILLSIKDEIDSAVQSHDSNAVKSTCSTDFPLDQCQCVGSIEPELAERHGVEEMNVTSSCVRSCTEDCDEEMCWRDDSEEVSRSCIYGSGVHEDACSVMNLESDVEVVDNVPSASAEDGGDVPRLPLLRASVIECQECDVKSRFSYVFPQMNSVHFGISVMEFTSSNLDVTVQKSLFLWHSSDGGYGHEWIERWDWSNVYMNNVNIGKTVSWKFCIVFLHCNKSFVLKKIWNILCLSWFLLYCLG
ncbi:mitogen-activated protein kinase kinase kinase YODA [Physcomitrium patens]|uniref:Protein kinase domain-containing protein n=1 Tax=Physcomitrium patens TaxID=3218 RepID=A0A2K1L225_PHYPA|nr:hypothetical protein PHYPA_002877 [Physcomitrium patens]